MAVFSTISLRNYISITVISVALAACGGGGGDPQSKQPDPIQKTTHTGVFIDSAVAGVAYVTETKSGMTNVAGEYEYLEGESVSFYIGDILLGTTTAGPIVTPVSIVDGATDATDPVVKNIIRLLVTLDSDGDPSNGIDVTAAQAAATGTNISVDSTTFESDVSAFIVAVKGVGATLVDEIVAINHFNETLQTGWGTSVWGSDCWQTVCS
jgi:hypothetical protein